MDRLTLREQRALKLKSRKRTKVQPTPAKPNPKCNIKQSMRDAFNSQELREIHALIRIGHSQYRIVDCDLVIRVVNPIADYVINDKRDLVPHCVISTLESLAPYTYPGYTPARDYGVLASHHNAWCFVCCEYVPRVIQVDRPNITGECVQCKKYITNSCGLLFMDDDNFVFETRIKLRHFLLGVIAVPEKVVLEECENTLCIGCHANIMYVSVDSVSCDTICNYCRAYFASFSHAYSRIPLLSQHLVIDVVRVIRDLYLRSLLE